MVNNLDADAFRGFLDISGGLLRVFYVSGKTGVTRRFREVSDAFQKV